MANIKDLEKLTSDEPRTFDEWLSRFDDDDRDLVVDSIITSRLDDVFNVISNLDVNPYPFRRQSLNGFRNRLMEGE